MAYVYSPGKTLAKGAGVAGSALSGAGIALALLAMLRSMGLEIPTEVDTVTVWIFTVVAPAAVRMFNNWRKHGGKPGPYLPYVLALAGASLLLGGCATTTRTLPDGTVEVLRTVDPEQADMWFRIADQAIARIEAMDAPSPEEQARQAEWETFRAELVRYVLDRALGEPAVPPEPPQPLALQVLDGAKL